MTGRVQRVQGRSLQSLRPFGVLAGAAPLLTVVLRLTPATPAKVTAWMPLAIITWPVRQTWRAMQGIMGQLGLMMTCWLSTVNLHITTYWVTVILTRWRFTDAAASNVCAHRQLTNYSICLQYTVLICTVHQLYIIIHNTCVLIICRF